MEQMEETLARWREVLPRTIVLDLICTDDGLQARSLDVTQLRGRTKSKSRSAEHVLRFRRQLEARAQYELDPVLVAEVDGRHWLVDGHHRMKAYRLAGRRVISARIIQTTREAAVQVSKLVNLDGVKLPMEAAQLREACWQYVAHLTARGTRPLPKGYSQRNLSALFGIDRKTIAAMRRRLEERLDPRLFSEPDLDPGTKWPRWKAVNQLQWLKEAANRTQEQLLRGRAERIAQRIGQLQEDDPEAFRMAVELLLREKQTEEPTEALRGLDVWIDDGFEDF